MDEMPPDEVSVDELSAEMFDNPVVEVEGYQESKEDIEAACEVIFGRLLEPEEFAELISAPNASELLIEAQRYSDSLELKLSYRWFMGTHDYLLYVDEETGARVIEFDNIANQPDAPRYLETVLFAHQVQSFRKYGLDEIRLYADGRAGHPGGIIGYYVWARLGFMMALDGFGPQLFAAGFEPVDTTLDLFRQANGADWWYHHGSDRPAVFYLDVASPCGDVLEVYLKEKGIIVHGDENDGQEGGEEIHSDRGSS